MANITSVSMREIAPNRNPGIAVGSISLVISACAACVGIVGLANLNDSSSIGLIIVGVVIGLISVPGIGVGVAMVVLPKPTYVVRIGSASGEANILSSKDRASIQKIVAAINNAIIGRG